ncbi:marvel domain-containing protein [Pseudomassariella vexata]|uniref:Marvel domain-containing protein n=1 Tax=Pseudomassariella vexata TaxID=1141098 RepID=A0A1Y2DKE2_9PEZI|nr:marvel domain-containing protein [Pseudomassariella vexata]ORY59596.1 marvel domain-containing protein [Pseudomassariella vexata]
MEFVYNILRIVQILWTLLATALIGNVIASNVNAQSSAESAINFTMFVLVVCWIAALIGLISSFVNALAIPIVLLSLDASAVLFTFIAAIVLSAKLTAVNCGNLSGKASDYIAFGSNSDTKRCREIQASAAFLWFLLVCFVGTLFFAFKRFRAAGGSIRSGPGMSQIGV